MVLPSFYEGFGLTIIEAMSYGKPVITSNLSSMAEIAKDSALLIDPYDIDSIKSAMEKLINSTEKYNFYTSKGIKRYKNFQWSTTATEVLDVYRSVNKQ